MRDIERTEPVNVAPGQWIRANENRPFCASTTAPPHETAHGLPQAYRSARTVRALLNGALYAVFGGRGRQGRRQPTSLTRLVYMLAGSYHPLPTPPRPAPPPA